MNYVEYDVRDGIAYITLNRPQVLNALTDDIIRELREKLIELDDDDAASVAILSGKGRAFCSGADVRQRQLRDPEEMARIGPQDRGARIQDVMLNFTNWKPVIAAVHGYVMGAGLYLSIMSDIVVAARGTRFQITETSRGADATNFWALLTQRTSGAFATEVALTGRFYTAEEACLHGAVDCLADLGEQVQVAEQVARCYFLDSPQDDVRAMVRARRFALEQLELRAYSRRPRGLHLTADFRESARAFVEKRAGLYQGR
jgi:enoyl-CoA hydratase/carnithine racemase